jgi:MFS family permease
MKQRIALCIGIFLVMALSNAIVPVLPRLAAGSTAQGAIYAAYFFGAFLTTLPAGLLSDRFGKPPVIRSGIIITIFSGVLIATGDSVSMVLIGRCLEGLAAGIFVASSLSWVNSRQDHERLSGYFLASMNLGLVVGLIGTGWIVQRMGYPVAGVILFTVLAIIPAALSFAVRDELRGTAKQSGLLPFVMRYRWLWYSSVILIGITGVVISLYPGFSGEDPDLLAIQIAGMSIATIGAVLVASRLPFPPIPTIRAAAVSMAAGVIVCFVTPWGFLLLGALAGIVQIAQMAVLAGNRGMQGTAMGLFAAMSYGGMALLPAIAGFLAEQAGFIMAFGVMAALTGTVALTIGRSRPASTIT